MPRRAPQCCLKKKETETTWHIAKSSNFLAKLLSISHLHKRDPESRKQMFNENPRTERHNGSFTLDGNLKKDDTPGERTDP